MKRPQAVPLVFSVPKLYQSGLLPHRTCRHVCKRRFMPGAETVHGLLSASGRTSKAAGVRRPEHQGTHTQGRPSSGKGRELTLPASVPGHQRPGPPTRTECESLPETHPSCSPAKLTHEMKRHTGTGSVPVALSSVPWGEGGHKQQRSKTLSTRPDRRPDAALEQQSADPWSEVSTSSPSGIHFLWLCYDKTASVRRTGSHPSPGQSRDVHGAGLEG